MFAVTAKDIVKVGQVKELLTKCTREKDIEGVFELFEITDFMVKTMLLRQSMQIQEVFGTPDCGENVSPEAIYREELDFFVTGKWRDLV